MAHRAPAMIEPAVIPRLRSAQASFGRQLLRLGSLPLLCALALLVCLLASLFSAYSSHALHVEDDAFYYLIIAKNIARSGVSTFDGQTLTNGYHPLWMAVLVLEQLLTGSSLLVTLLIEAACVSGAIYLLLGLRPTSGPVAVAFTWALFLLMKRMLLAGMEVSLFVLCFAVFVKVSARQSSDRSGRSSDGLVLGASAALCIAARIDAALFVVPILLSLPLARKQIGVALAVLAALGISYAAFNLIVFGIALPISSVVKSLGGLQLNRPLLTQAAEEYAREGLRSRHLLTFVALLASPALVRVSKPGTFERAVCIGTSLGGLAYLAKLIFASSWRVWPWYDFAVLFPLASALLCLAPLAGARLNHWTSRSRASTWKRAAGLATAFGLALLLVQAAITAHKPVALGGSAAINRLAIQRFGQALGGKRVAMGDRAGSFAQEYRGPVTQLEGLVGDVAYLDALKRGGDLTPLLCSRGVEFLVDYELPLGAYGEHFVSVLRPRLTQAGGPTVRVHQRDELGHVQALDLYDNTRLGDEGDTTLYAWRLGACDHPKLTIYARELSSQMRQTPMSSNSEKRERAEIARRAATYSRQMNPARRQLIAVCSVLASTACGNAEQSQPDPPACVTQAGQLSSPLIDDFEDGDAALFQPTNRHGSWYSVNDGTGTQAPAPDADGLRPFRMSTPGSAKSPEYALRTVGWGFTGWGAIVTVDLNATPTGLCPYDVSAYSGFRFQVKGNGSLRINVGSQGTKPVTDGGQCPGSNCSDYGIALNLPVDWTEISVNFADLTQPSWASPAPWNAEAIERLSFWVEQGDFEFWIDDVEFY